MSPSGALGRRSGTLVVLLGFLGMCAALRSPVGVVPPLLGQVGRDLGLGEVGLGVLTSLPVLCFGVVTPLAARLVARTGVNTAGALMLGAVLVGSVVRVAAGTGAAMVGTVLVGAGITVGNLVAPMVIRRDFWHRTSLMMGLYSATCNVMVTAVTALAVPVAATGGWRVSTLLWTAVPVALALAVWLWVYPPGVRSARLSLLGARGADGAAEAPAVGELGAPGRREEEPAEAGTAAPGPHSPATAAAPAQAPATAPVSHASARPPVLRRPMTWVMALGFTGHVFSYYAVVSWLPTALTDLTGMSEAQAGVAASVFSLTGIVGPLLVPVMLDVLRWSGARMLAVVCLSWLVLPVCLVLAPQWWLLPCAVSGTAQGAYFAGVLSIVVTRSADVDESRLTTAAMQSVGYTLAALGPVVAGWLHGLSGGWTLPFAVVVGALVVMTACGQLSASDRGTRYFETLEGRRMGTTGAGA